MHKSEIFYHDIVKGRTFCIKDPPTPKTLKNLKLSDELTLVIGASKLNPNDKHYVKSIGRAESRKKCESRNLSLCMAHTVTGDPVFILEDSFMGLSLKIKNDKVFVKLAQLKEDM